MKVLNVVNCLDIAIYSVLSLSLLFGIILLAGCQTAAWDTNTQVSSKGTVSRDSPPTVVDGNGNVTRNQIPPNGGTDEKSDRSPVEPP
jgi:hypothetical protein